MTIATHAHDDVTTLELTGALTIVDGVKKLSVEYGGEWKASFR